MLNKLPQLLYNLQGECPTVWIPAEDMGANNKPDIYKTLKLGHGVVILHDRIIADAPIGKAYAMAGNRIEAFSNYGNYNYEDKAGNVRTVRVPSPLVWNMHGLPCTKKYGSFGSIIDNPDNLYLYDGQLPKRVDGKELMIKGDHVGPFVVQMLSSVSNSDPSLVLVAPDSECLRYIMGNPRH